jgi:amidohydrolase
MIEAGVLDDPKVDAAFGIHMANDMPVGLVGMRAGALQAAADLFRIVIQGKGGHGAMPHIAVDPIVVGAQIVTSLQTIVSRETNPLDAAVVTVGAFNAGQANNVIPETAELKGTVRTFDQTVRETIAQRMEEMVTGMARAMGATAVFEYTWGYPPLVNNSEMTEIVRQAATEVVGPERVIEPPQIMAGEDMSYFLHEVPGCFFMVGSRNEAKGLVWGHHHPRFDIDETSLGIGIEVMVTTVQRYFEQSGAVSGG